MTLDDRAARAAESLRRRVEPQLDVALARTTVRQAAAGRRDRLRAARVGGAAVLAVVLVGGFVAFGGDAGDDGLTTDGLALERYDTQRDPRETASVLGAMPTSPIDGKQSWRLPVVARPQSGLSDGDVVTLYGRGFRPGEQVGVVMCTSEADTADSGVDACQLANGPEDSFGAVTYATVSSKGDVAVDVVVRRFVTTPAGGEVDCLAAAERCLVGMGAVSDYDRSGGSYVAFDGAPPFAEPTVALDAAGPYAPGQQVVARVAGVVPLRAVRVQQCIEDRCQNLVDGRVDDAGAAALPVVLQPNIAPAEGGALLSCDGACVLRINGIGVEGASSAPLPPDVPLAFTSPEPVTTPGTATVAPEPPDTTNPPASTPGADAPVPPSTTRPRSEATTTTEAAAGS
jgi:hypothetical protein